MSSLVFIQRGKAISILQGVKSSSTYISYAVLGPYFSRYTQCHLFCYVWLRKIQPTEKVRFLVSCFQTFELREPLFKIIKKKLISLKIVILFL